jgi:hypothetical protein
MYYSVLLKLIGQHTSKYYLPGWRKLMKIMIINKVVTKIMNFGNNCNYTTILQYNLFGI